MLKIDDLYFGICRWDSNKKQMVSENVFDYPRVKWALAYWKTHPDKRPETNLADWVFADFRGKCEHEWICSSFFSNNEDEEQKVDVFQMYIEPNRHMLIDLMSDVSLNSCVKWLRAYNKRRKSTK